jgi:thiamine-monophosphate kinase
MCSGAGLTATIHAGLVPTSPDAAAFGPAFLEHRLTDGDDYELILAVPPGHESLFFSACAELAVTKIGVFSAGVPGVTVLDEAGAVMTFVKSGWRHF